MQAVVLSGGLGTRLMPMTLGLPKPMIPVWGRPFLEHQLLPLAGFGIEEMAILTGYRAGVTEGCFGDGRSLGLSIMYSREGESPGTGGALVKAACLLEESFFLLYGDSFPPWTAGTPPWLSPLTAGSP